MVRTPLQLLNAVEARLHFGFHRTALIVLEYSGVGLPPFDLSYIDPADWSDVQIIDLNPHRRPFPFTCLDHPLLRSSEKVNVLKQYHQRRILDQALCRWRDIPFLLLGNYLQGWFRHAAQRCALAECILLDDGTDTLRIAGYRHQLDDRPEAVSIWRRPKVWWYNRFATWIARQRRQVTFFSSYELDLPPCDRYVKNTYRHTRERMQAVRRDRRCLFLGQPLVEDGYLTPAEFRRLLSSVKASLEGFDLHYIPHRRENPEGIAGLLEELGIAVLRLDKAFEYWLLASPALPAVVASFFSSALDNCRLIMDDSIRIMAFHLPPDSLQAAHDYVEQVYAYFRTAGHGGIEIIEPGDPVPSIDRDNG
jgi:hypothetical protein